MSKLFEEFKKVSDREWLDKISADLKGKSADDIAKSKVYDDIDLNVFYSAQDTTVETSINVQRDWKIITDSDFIQAVIADPINHFIRTGFWLYEEEYDLNEYIDTYKAESGQKNIGVNGLIYNLAGASAVQELSMLLAHANDYFHILHSHKLLDKNVLKKLSVKVGIGGDFFLEIAKFRALRILMRNLAKAYGLNSDLPIQIYAENNVMNYSANDVDTNILRATTACMSAVIGNCDHLIINPHDHFREGMHEFGNRIARNLQLMMKHEGHLDKVIDPASGSYYVEKLTVELSKKAWSMFKHIESDGGLIAAFQKGEIQKMVEETAQKRIDRFKDGSDVLVGINKYQVKSDAGPSSHKQSESHGNKALKPLILEHYL